MNQRSPDLGIPNRFSPNSSRFSDPNYVEAHVNRGVLLRELERHAEALVSFDRALALRSESREILYNRANSLQSVGRSSEALQNYDALLAADPAAIEALELPHRNPERRAIAELLAFGWSANTVTPGSSNASLFLKVN